jgi:hypothetical protein
VKKVMFVVAILALLLLGACEPVADAHSRSCDALLDASQKMATTKAAVLALKPVQTIIQVQDIVKQVRQDMQTAQASNTAVKDSPNTIQLVKALDEIDAAIQGESEQRVVSRLQAKLLGPVSAAQQNASSLYGRLCAAN